jgi:hypothetical protein
MPSMTHSQIRPSDLLLDMRKSVSEILNKPVTDHIDHQIFKPDQKILALWAADCAEHVLPYFEEKYSEDRRPRKAIETLHLWITTGRFRMAVIRKVSLDAHAAARQALDASEDAACLAAHSAGQAVATAHVATNALGSSIYAIRAAAAHSGNADAGLIGERDWQLQRLRLYKSNSTATDDSQQSHSGKS